MTQTKENKMGVMPVKALIINMSLPMMISMLVQALYNVVDSIFVAQLSENSLTAVSLAFPLQNLMIAVGSGTGVGINAILSRALGEKNFKRANKTASTALLLSLFNYLVFLVIALFGTRPFIYVMTKDPDVSSQGITYLMIVMTASIGVFYQITFERLLQATGRTIFSMITQLCGAIINLILDPILIFGLFGFPKLGIAGAAIATVAGQIIAAFIGLMMNIRNNPEITFDIPDIIHPDLRLIEHIYIIGIPSILMMSIGSVMCFLMNMILLTF
jgi:putative MATE family efflux protein